MYCKTIFFFSFNIDDGQSDFAAKLKNLDKYKTAIERESLLNNLELFFSAKEKVLNTLKVGNFQ